MEQFNTCVFFLKFELIFTNMPFSQFAGQIFSYGQISGSRIFLIIKAFKSEFKHRLIEVYHLIERFLVLKFKLQIPIILFVS